MEKKDNVKKNKNVKIIFLAIIVIVVIASCIGFYFYFNPLEVKIEKKADAYKYTEKVNSLVFKGVSKDRVKRVLKYDIPDELFIVGKDSFQRNKPSSEIIKKYKLNNYVNEANKLADKLDEKITDNFNVKILKTSKDYNMFLSKVEYQTFYYFDYISDLQTLEGEILSRVNVSYDDNSNDAVVNKYKAKVKAMQILDNYLDNYVNKSEKKSFDLYLFNGKSSKSNDEVIAYLYQILGYDYNNLVNSRNERIIEYSSKINNERILDL